MFTLLLLLMTIIKFVISINNNNNNKRVTSNCHLYLFQMSFGFTHGVASNYF